MKRHTVFLIFNLFILIVFGLTTIWSTAPSLFLSQLSFVVAAVIIALLVYRLDVKSVSFFSWFWYLFPIFLLIVTHFLGKNIRGSIRWIDFGIMNLQTSEIAKPLLLLFYAWFLNKQKKITWRILFFYLGLISIPFFLVYKQPDLGSALTMISFPLVLLIAKGELKKLLVVLSLFLIVAIPLEQFLLKPYQRQRIESFINPYSDPQGAGYNVIQANIAIGSGGFFGKGVRLGTQSQLNFLPERHTDFVFSSFAEEFGLFGASIVILLYFNSFRIILEKVYQVNDVYYQFVGIGILSIFFFQTIVNIGMNLGIMPVTGITLPLFSYGGSSLLSFGILFGMLFRILDLVRPFRL